MKRTISILLVAVLAAVYAVPAFGWGQEGHRIIAQIAYDHLTKKARKAVDNTLGDHGMIYWANWADEIKSDTIYAESIKDGWHYQDFDGGMSDEAVLDALVNYPKEGGNMFRALDSLEVVLREGKGDVHTLRFFVHLNGDLCCPMHTARIEDKGGNAIKMKWFGRDTRLHTVWDTNLIESQGYSYTEFAAKLERDYASKKKAIEQMSKEELLLHN